MAKSDGELFACGTVAPSANDVLSALPLEEYKRLLPNLELVTFDLGKVVYESGERLNYIYFPTTSVVSILYIMEDGATAEMGLVGRDGVVGIALFLEAKRFATGRSFKSPVPHSG